MRRIGWAGVLALCALLSAEAAQQENWKKDLGKPAPELISAGWVGTPVSLEAVRGNAVALVFWTADVPC